MALALANRERMDRKLVELVKPHEILYNGKNSSHDYMNIRSDLWNNIAERMNRTFNVDRTMDEWKTRWLALRSSYRQGMEKTNMVRRSNVCDDMEFLRPFTHINAKIGRTNYKKSSKKSKKSLSKNLSSSKVTKATKTIKKANGMKQEKHRPLKLVTNSARSFHQANSDYEDDSLAYSDSSYAMVKRETIEATNACFEIIVPDDEATVIDDELSVDTENHLAGDIFDEDMEDSDGAFGTLITRELREMEPAAKRAFKRTVTQLLYS